MYVISSVIVAWGVKKSSTLNKAFTLLNLLTLGTVVVSGFFLGKYEDKYKIFLDCHCNST